jgi:AcrR family transcriptional regulator
MPIDRAAKFERQHARLLDGLAASIRERGLAQTGVGDIVRHARASRRTFYNHFPDKDSCFVELAELIAGIAISTVAATVEPEAPPAAQIDQAIDAYLSLLTSEPQITLTLSSPSLGERVVRAQREGLERFAAFFVSVLEADAERDRSVRPISIERAYMLISGLRDVVLRAIERGEDPARAAAEGKAIIRSALQLDRPVSGRSPRTVRRRAAK